jgi:hypothetical protein
MTRLWLKMAHFEVEKNVGIISEYYWLEGVISNDTCFVKATVILGQAIPFTRLVLVKFCLRNILLTSRHLEINFKSPADSYCSRLGREG